MGSQPKDPLITDIETYTGVTDTAVLWGYLGDVDNYVQKLYSDLTRERWVEIYINDIKFSKHLGEAGGSLVWVIKNALVKQVGMRPAVSLDVALLLLRR